MHYLIGLGMLAGLVWFAFGVGAARILVGAVLLGVVAFVGLIVVVAWIEIHSQSVEQQAASTQHDEVTNRDAKIDADLALRGCLAKHDWDRATQIECEKVALDRVKGVAPNEIHSISEKLVQEGEKAATEARRRNEEYFQKTRACFEKNSGDRVAQSNCTK